MVGLKGRRRSAALVHWPREEAPMSLSGERSEGGSYIMRHKERKTPFQPATGDSDLIDAISGHIERHIGPVDMVFHEIVSDMIHLDVHQVRPSERFPFHTLVTSGMSEAPMTVPEGYPGPRYLELCMCLPRDWRMPGPSEEEHGEAAVERLCWPVRWLKNLARLPHEYDTFLGYGHTVPNGDPPEPVADNAPFRCMTVTLPYAFPPGFGRLEASGRQIMFLMIAPLFVEEMNLKLKRGAEALEDLWE